MQQLYIKVYFRIHRINAAKRTKDILFNIVSIAKLGSPMVIFHNMARTGMANNLFLSWYVPTPGSLLISPKIEVMRPTIGSFRTRN
jgi:hypothetical protein